MASDRSSIVLTLVNYLYTNSFTVLIFLVVFYATWKFLTRQKRLPPGPRGVPIFGYLPFLNKAGVAPLAMRYGKLLNSDVIYVDLWLAKMVLVNSYDRIKEVFVKRDDCADRLSNNLFNRFNEGHEGILFSSGSLWKEHRRFALSVLRDFGMGKIAAEETITEEVSQMMRAIEELDEKPFNPRDILTESVSNIICSMIFGQRYEYEDKEFLKLVKNVNEFGGDLENPATIVLLRSWMRHLPECLDVLGFQSTLRKVQHIVGFGEARIAEHKAKFDPDDIKDYIDMYLLRMNEGKESFTDFQLSCEIFDLFFAGTETTSTTLRWVIYFMVKYPEVQKQVQNEIDSQIGRNRLPTMKDKLLLPYTEAVLMETHRMATIIPNGVFHGNLTQDITIGDYVIPKGFLIAPNILAVHRDPATWPDPENFNTSNFLDDNGKFRNQDRLIPFVIGRRSCIGEALAKMELFLFFTSWLQRFTIVCSDKKELDAPPFGVIKQPSPFHVRFEKRK